MKNKSFWEPNSDSKLTNSFFRWINYIGLFVFGFFNLTFLLAYIEVNLEIHSFALFVPVIVIAGLSLSLWIVDKIKNHTSFFLWDYTERKKKDRFIFTSFLVCGFMSIMSTMILFLNIYIVWHSIRNGTDYFIGWDKAFACIINITAFILFSLNPLFYVELFYPFFENNLSTEYKIQKKPASWIETGKEIRNEDEFKEIYKRDFGIDLD